MKYLIPPSEGKSKIQSKGKKFKDTNFIFQKNTILMKNSICTITWFYHIFTIRNNTKTYTTFFFFWTHIISYNTIHDYILFILVNDIL